MSAIAHAPLLAYMGHLATPSRPRPRVLVAPMPTNEVVAEPIEVAFLEESAAADVEVGPRPPAAAAVRAMRVATTNTAAATEARPGTETGTGTGTGYMRMRGQELGPAVGTERGATLGLDATAAERIAAAGDRPDELRKSGKLESRPGGGAMIHDRVTTVTVDPDGKVHFNDKKDIDLKLQLPIPKVWEIETMRKDLGHQLTEWFKDPEAGKRYGRFQDLPRHLQAAPGACDSWGAGFCDDPLAPETEKRVRERKAHGGRGVAGTILGGPMDITAWLHRKFIGDPYASRKRKLLDDTFDERVAMGVEHRAQQQLRSAELMRRNLERLWQKEKNPVARRAALFELWDECGDEEAGTRARAIVIGWIRTHLPAGHPNGYSDEELAILQTRRTSRAAFEPYVP